MRSVRVTTLFCLSESLHVRLINMKWHPSRDQWVIIVIFLEKKTMWISIRNTLKNGWEYSRGPRVRGRGLRPPSWPNTGCIYGKFKTKVSGSRDWTTCQLFWFFRLLSFLCAVQKAGHYGIVVRIPRVFHICCGKIVSRACFKSFSTRDHAFNRVTL